MLEKLLLAAILTFTLNLFTTMSWSSSNQPNDKVNLPNNMAFTLNQLYK